MEVFCFSVKINDWSEERTFTQSIYNRREFNETLIKMKLNKLSIKSIQIEHAATPLAAFAYFSVCHLGLGLSVGVRESLISSFILFVLLAFYRPLALAYLIIWGAMAFVYSPFSELYGPPDANALIAVLNTNLNEAIEFASSIPIDAFAYWSAILLGVFFIAYSSRTTKISKKWLLMLTPAAIAVLLSAPVKFYKLHGTVNPYLIKSNEVQLVRHLHTAFNSGMNQRQGLLSHINDEPNWRDVEIHKDLPKNVVFVLGESSRVDFTGEFSQPSYGNTPWFDSTNGVVFSNFYSPAASTHQSLAKMLFIPGRIEIPENPADNVITLMKQVGYKTAWISASNGGREIRTIPGFVGSFADYSHWLPRQASLDYLTDRSTLDYYKEFMEKFSSEKTFAVVHIYGSHPDACSRTNGEYSKFYYSERISCYIESMKKIDEMLEEYVSFLKGKNESWALVYVSDHGQKLVKIHTGYDLKHGDDDRMSYRVPAVFVKSADTERIQIDDARSGRFFLSMFADWLGISANGLDGFGCAWMQNGECEEQTYAYTYKGDYTDASKLNTTTLDELMRK